MQFMFLAIIITVNIFWAHLRAHYNPQLTAGAERSLSHVQNIFMATNKVYSLIILCVVHEEYLWHFFSSEWQPGEGTIVIEKLS